MSVIVIHRKNSNPPRPVERGESQRQEGQRNETRESRRQERRTGGMSNFRYSLKDTGKSLALTVEAMMNSQKAIKGKILIPKNTWSHYSIYFSGGLQKFILVDSNINNPILRSFVSEENYIGKVVTTDTETLLYLRGRIPNIPGFKNVVIDYDKTSMDAIASVSPKARRFIEKSVNQQIAFSQVDLLKYLALLETQVDLLTQCIVTGNTAQVKPILAEALKLSSTAKLDGKALQKRLQYKKVTNQALKGL